jgi:hypothetical protein
MKLHKDSHLDHGLSAQQLAHVLLMFEGRDGFFTETITLPEELGTVPCALFGPCMGDKPIPSFVVEMQQRGDRSYKSRVITIGTDGAKILDMKRRVNTLSVIAGPHDGHPCVLYTVFGGPIAPREPGDPTHSDGTAKGRAALAESIAFWAEHALVEVAP